MTSAIVAHVKAAHAKAADAAQAVDANRLRNNHVNGNGWICICIPQRPTTIRKRNVTYLDVLRQAELRGLDIIAFTDHNTVAGYAALRNELQFLLQLEQLKRIQPEELRRLNEYRRLLDKILVLPGFEFTAMFGFHIIGIFPQDTSISFMEHLLLKLNIPADKLQEGSSTVGATADVLTAYQVINNAGGIVIAAHANSSNGVAMRHLDFGGQTRIAYTQDPNLHVLEVTDLEKRSRYTTQRFLQRFQAGISPRHALHSRLRCAPADT